jgi:hypothetical protein
VSVSCLCLCLCVYRVDLNGAFYLGFSPTEHTSKKKVTSFRI